MEVFIYMASIILSVSIHTTISHSYEAIKSCRLLELAALSLINFIHKQIQSDYIKLFYKDAFQWFTYTNVMFNTAQWPYTFRDFLLLPSSGDPLSKNGQMG